MKRLRFDDIEEFCIEVLNKYTELDKDEFEDISIIAKYEEAKDIIGELICIGFNVHSIDIHDKEWDRYSSEYIISLCNCDSDHDLFCDPMKHGEKYISDEATVTYILDNCSSRVIDCCEGEIIYEVSIGVDEDYDEYEYDCANCDLDECPRCSELDRQESSEKFVEYSKDEEGDLHGFSASRSDGNSYFGYSFYTSDRLDVDDIRSILKEIGF